MKGDMVRGRYVTGTAPVAGGRFAVAESDPNFGKIWFSF
jgi:hypothetical protein